MSSLLTRQRIGFPARNRHNKAYTYICMESIEDVI